MKIYKGQCNRTNYREFGFRFVNNKLANDCFFEICIWKYFIGIDFTNKSKEESR